MHADVGSGGNSRTHGGVLFRHGRHVTPSHAVFFVTFPGFEGRTTGEWCSVICQQSCSCSCSLLTWRRSRLATTPRPDLVLNSTRIHRDRPSVENVWKLASPYSCHLLLIPSPAISMTPAATTRFHRHVRSTPILVGRRDDGQVARGPRPLPLLLPTRALPPLPPSYFGIR